MIHLADKDKKRKRHFLNYCSKHNRLIMFALVCDRNYIFIELITNGYSYDYKNIVYINDGKLTFYFLGPGAFRIFDKFSLYL